MDVAFMMQKFKLFDNCFRVFDFPHARGLCFFPWPCPLRHLLLVILQALFKVKFEITGINFSSVFPKCMQKVNSF